jgi:flagellar motor switch protein FliN
MTDQTKNTDSRTPTGELSELPGALPVQIAEKAGDEVNPAVGSINATDAGESMNLDLVMDVELNVTLRFGQRQLTLREVLELTAGSVVELDRQIEEPVELLLDGKVIARGEAVVIDGNYGIRVLEVPHPVIAAHLRP